MNIIIRFSFWGLVLWFPVVFAFLYAVDHGFLEVDKMDFIGNVAASLFIVFSASLWVCCVIRLFKFWSIRSNRRNCIYLVLLFFGTIVGSFIFYLIDFRKNQFDAERIR
jgi:hypothetical protein